MARAIVATAVTRELEPIATAAFGPWPGVASGQLGWATVAAGSAALMQELGWPPAPNLAERGRAHEASGFSVMYAGWGERVHGVLSLDNSPLPEARATIEALGERGVRVMLLTGDLAAAARRIAAAVGIEVTMYRRVSRRRASPRCWVSGGKI